jgi:transposase
MIAVGIDSHRDSLAACALDELGRQLAAAEFPNRPAGHRRLERWLGRLPAPRRIGIEGSGGLGAAAAARLLAGGEAVFEVPTARTRRERRHLGSPGKSDAGDALAIARVVAAEPELRAVLAHCDGEELRLLCDYRDGLVAERTRLANRLHAELARRLPGYRARIGGLGSSGNRARLARLLGDRDALWAELARRRLRRINGLCREIASLEERIALALADRGSRLTEVAGVGALTAARLLGEVGEISRFRSAAAFAMAAGVAPIPASSGQVHRYRLNRGGNRRLNGALHTIALVQARHDERARAYLERKRADGMSSREAIRCLKRHLANVVYRQMLADSLELPVTI